MPNPVVAVPVDYNAIRAAFAAEVFRVTKVPCVLAEPTVQNAPRPTNPGNTPYFSFKITTPGAKSGDDHSTYDHVGNVYNRGGQRKMTVSFQCYAQQQEEAYNLMALWQGSLELFQVQLNLRAAGIAVWIIGDVADLSALLNTGYEGRSQMDCTFGVASNLTQDLGEIDTAVVTGEIASGTEEIISGPFNLTT